MNKKEKQVLASKCGYEYLYSGKTKSGNFIKLNNTQNIMVNPDDMRNLNEVIAQENK